LFLPDKGHPPVLFALAPGQQEDLAASSLNAPRLEALFLSAQQGLVQSGPHLVLLLAVQAALQAALQLALQAGASSAALRLGDVVELVLVQPAIARTMLIPRVLSMKFIPISCLKCGRAQHAGI
jgi:hypothetical protein